MTFIIELDERSEVPIYAQIRNSVVEGIKTGLLNPGDQLQSSRLLAKNLGINYHTVNKAYNILISEGYLYRDRKKRTMISREDREKKESFLSQWSEQERSLVEEAISRGIPAQEMMKIFKRALGSKPE